VKVSQVATEARDGRGVPAGADVIVVEVQQVRLDPPDGEKDNVAVVSLGRRVVAVPEVAVGGAVVSPRPAGLVEQDPVAGRGDLAEERLPQERAAVRVHAHAQAGVMAELGEPDRLHHALVLGLRAGAFVAVHHNEVHTEVFQSGEHLRAVLAPVSGLLLRGRQVIGAAVAAHAEQQRLPTAGHDDPVLPQPGRAPVRREGQRLGPRRAAETAKQNDNPCGKHREVAAGWRRPTVRP
jgi:hypothetical protein